MKSEEVAHYLLNNPEFFEEYAETLAQINLPHPHGGRTISLAERQMFELRERNKLLEKKLCDLVEFAKGNDGLQHKVHEFTTSLFACRNLATLQEMIPHLLQDIFAVPHVALHLWQIKPPSMETLIFTEGMSKPVCLHQPVLDTGGWFGENAARLHSYAYLPLHAGSTSIGLLVLASEDKQRFYPEMGTIFLQRLSEAASSALHTYLDH